MILRLVAAVWDFIFTTGRILTDIRTMLVCMVSASSNMDEFDEHEQSYHEKTALVVIQKKKILSCYQER
jgi:hypothetical protein